MLSSNCAVCDSNKSKSIRKQETEGITDNFGVFARIRSPSLAM